MGEAGNSFGEVYTDWFPEVFAEEDGFVEAPGGHENPGDHFDVIQSEGGDEWPDAPDFARSGRDIPSLRSTPRVETHKLFPVLTSDPIVLALPPDIRFPGSVRHDGIFGVRTG